jgi:hypothetical protein
MVDVLSTYIYEYGTETCGSFFKKGGRENNGRDELNLCTLYAYMEMSK